MIASIPVSDLASQLESQGPAEAASGRLRNRRVYVIPSAQELEQAFADPDTVVELAEEMRRRA